MAGQIIFLVEESDEGGYDAKALSHAIFTVGDMIEEIRAMIKDAVRCHFDEEEMPNIHILKGDIGCESL